MKLVFQFRLVPRFRRRLPTNQPQIQRVELRQERYKMLAEKSKGKGRLNRLIVGI